MLLNTEHFECTWKLDSWMGWGIDAAIRVFVRNIALHMKKHFLHENEYNVK